MNIVPTAKGLVTGRMKFRFLTASDQHDDWFDCEALADEGGSLSITSKWTECDDDDLEIVVHQDVKVILVVEKEGIFHRLCEDKFHLIVPCIIVTGSG